MNKKIVIGLVGEKGGGKGTFASLLQEFLPNTKIEKFKFSDPLFETLNLWFLPTSRENLTKLSITMNETFGPGTLANVVQRRMEESDIKIVIVDGMRWQADVDFVKKQENNMIVYVTADSKIRYERTKGRGEKVGEDNTSYEQFVKEEQAETETMIPKIGQEADVKIENNGSFEEFKSQVENFVNTRLKSQI